MNESLPRWFQLFLGVAEVAAAVGLSLPRLTDVKPWLVAYGRRDRADAAGTPRLARSV